MYFRTPYFSDCSKRCLISALTLLAHKKQTAIIVYCSVSTLMQVDVNAPKLAVVQIESLSLTDANCLNAFLKCGGIHQKGQCGVLAG